MAFRHVGSCVAGTHDGVGHLLELPQKMQYGAQMYSAVSTSLYRYFAIVGGVYQVGSIIAAGVLAFMVRKRMTFTLTLIGFFCLLLAFGVWLAVVAPVNSDVFDALRLAPESVPMLWLRLRNRWEYGHAAGFVLQLVGFGALVLSVLMETPKVWEGEKNARRVSERTREQLMTTHGR